MVINQSCIQELEKFFLKDIHDAFAWNNSLCAKLKPFDMKIALIYKRVSADFLELAPRHYGHSPLQVTGLRRYCWL